MAELGQTQVPAALVPGKPEAVEENARVLRARADQAGRASEGLKAIDTGAWEGPAAHAFHDKFSYEPSKWYKAADALLAAADALEHYAITLRWAQGQAAEAIASWAKAETITRQAQVKHDQDAASGQPVPPFVDPGAAIRQAARDTLDRARGQLGEVGDVVAGAIRDATEGAPQASSWLDDVGNFFADAGSHLLNGAASVLNAVVNHPGDAVMTAAGIGLTMISAAGEGGGFVLDATGVGAIAGVPLNAVSAAGMVAGGTMAAAGAANIAKNASGDDRVSPMRTNQSGTGGGAAEPPFEPPKGISGKTQHGETQMAGRDGHGVNDAAAHDAVNNPVKAPRYIPDQYGGTYRFTGKDAIVSLNERGEVVTAWARSRAGWRTE
ncbi:putative T7SS-secreted protein [Amycolatopsis sp. NPDC004625]|uniref:putative T7SS-secreted protein n=1 Tax=Amycolatopsis sp. NPDC004625 TaxID=3154670 RepID=UPI0033A12FFF